MPAFLEKICSIYYSSVTTQAFFSALMFFICLTGAAAQNSPAGFAPAPSAATININGRVLSPSGRGVSRATICMTDQRGDSQIAVTNFLGFYSFKEIPAGETYIFTVQSKRFRFGVQIVVITEDIEKLDFKASP